MGPRPAPDIEVVPVQLPGREHRVAEPASWSASELVARLTGPMLDHAGQDFALFGHSMGALLAFELSHTLARHGCTPRHLFVSGFDAPHELARSEHPPHALTDEELLADVSVLDGTPPEILESEEPLQLLLPVLRADSAITDTYVFTPRRPLSVPLSVINGQDEVLVSQSRLSGWTELSKGPVEFIRLVGDHFYVTSNRSELLAVVRRTLLPRA
ncbi:thioesterase II family protein [Streptomyces fuscichromogenes]|uniref:Thioesterase n=1 Tax=Streptomyces fuscichromogenes TaxID=1324013 RepID=A0A917XP61_9ACTN|nr:alpha/beta fold hydrolase [Streptomyces fuscichromogenes]GGN45593.1 thioesterase [Streptomyces fuscichromogenes]